ncbi:MAG: hypothetical protein AAF433_01520 [Bacteroidota bacterium]
MLAQSGLRLGRGVRLGDSTQLQLVSTTRFDKIIGYGLNIDGDELVFQPQNMDETLSIPLEYVRSLRLYKQTLEDDRFSDPSYLRTALPGADGRLQYRNLMLLSNMVEYDINSNIRIGAGVLVPVGLSFTQRLRVSLADRIHLGVSNQSVWDILIDDGDSFGNSLAGDLSGILTLGSNQAFVSVSYHLLYDTSFPTDEHAIGLAVGGQLSPAWHLYSELFFVEQASGGTGFVPSVSGAYRVNNWRFRMGLFAGFLDLFTNTPLPFLGVEYYW